ncbi:MAG: RluA family pseudouridine synthase [Clostridia bacterium]|nr:RluA family pseudouridine synthase [Clostridia bacterium]
MKMLSLTVTKEQDNLRVQDVLRDVYDVSESYLSKLKRRPGALLLNGEPVYTTAKVRPNDTVAFDPSDTEKLPIRPIPHSLSIAYEDEWLLVLDKPAHMSVHPARDPDEHTVENALAAYFTGTDNPHPVSRLDKGTTGLLTVAKSGYIHARMKTIQHAGRFQKTYLALVKGVPTEARFTIDAPIGPETGSTYRQCVRSDGADAKSVCEVLETKDGITLVRLTPYTGRMHQLRVHMAYAGYPLLGDWLYGERSTLIDRAALHAAALTFTHPITGKEITLSAPLPPDMARLF